MRTFDEEIARSIQQAADSGELSRAEGYGKPLVEDPAWAATPAALRMPMKILKDNGAVPPEVTLFHERARLRAALAAATDAGARQALQRALDGVEQTIVLRLEALRIYAAT